MKNFEQLMQQQLENRMHQATLEGQRQKRLQDERQKAEEKTAVAQTYARYGLNPIDTIRDELLNLVQDYSGSIAQSIYSKCPGAFKGKPTGNPKNWLNNNSVRDDVYKAIASELSFVHGSITSLMEEMRVHGMKVRAQDNLDDADSKMREMKSKYQKN